MKYSEVKPGKRFYIEQTYSYPKVKTNSGHVDLRDRFENLHGNPDWNVNLESPILFQGWKVNKILNWDWVNSNMQTMRVMNPQPPDDYAHLIGPEMYTPTVIDKYGEEQPGDEIYGVYTEDGEWGWKCPYGQPGDLLWVRETHAFITQPLTNKKTIIYKATHKLEFPDEVQGFDGGKWRPSIFMPRWASRIDLGIVDVRVGRVQDISHKEALMEGIDPDAPYNDYGTGSIYKDTFAQVWDSINAKRGYGWYVNPWVWVVEYKRVLRDGVAQCL